MSIFDIFTGAPAKKAAEENQARINANLASGTNILNTGQTNALGALDSAAAAYQPLSALGTKYGQGTDLYLDALGVNGSAGNTRAAGAFTTQPGYQEGIDAGIDVLNRRRAAGGMLASGNADLDALQFGQNAQNGQWNNWLSGLSGLNQNALSATEAAASGIAGANTNRAGVYQGTAGALTNLGTMSTTGLNDQSTQSANAQMAGSGNLWGLGMSLANLAAGKKNNSNGSGGGSGGLFGGFFGS